MSAIAAPPPVKKKGDNLSLVPLSSMINDPPPPISIEGDAAAAVFCRGRETLYRGGERESTAVVKEKQPLIEATCAPRQGREKPALAELELFLCFFEPVCRGRRFFRAVLGFVLLEFVFWEVSCPSALEHLESKGGEVFGWST